MTEQGPEGHIQRFNHIALLVTDLEASRRWYRDVLGWEEQFTADMTSDLGDGNGFTGKPGRITLGRVAGVGVEFVQMSDAALGPWQRNDHCGLFLISFRIDDVDWFRDHCAAHQVVVKRTVDIGASRCLVIADPDGQEIFLVAGR